MINGVDACAFVHDQVFTSLDTTKDGARQADRTFLRCLYSEPQTSDVYQEAIRSVSNMMIKFKLAGENLGILPQASFSSASGISVIRNMEGSPESKLVLDYGKICCQYFVAPMGSGKTEAIKSLIHSAAQTGIYKWFLVMSPTRLSGEWDCLPDEAVVSFSPEKMQCNYRLWCKCPEKGKVNKIHIYWWLHHLEYFLY